MQGGSVIKLLRWGSSPIDAEGDRGTQGDTHRGSGGGGGAAQLPKQREAAALRQGRAKQQVISSSCHFKEMPKSKNKRYNKRFFRGISQQQLPQQETLLKCDRL